MYGMHLSQALVFSALVVVLIVATQWRHVHAFLAIVLVATAFGAYIIPVLAVAVFPGRREAMLCAIGGAIVALGGASALSFLAAAKPAKRVIERELGRAVRRSPSTALREQARDVPAEKSGSSAGP